MESATIDRLNSLLTSGKIDTDEIDLDHLEAAYCDECNALTSLDILQSTAEHQRLHPNGIGLCPTCLPAALAYQEYADDRTELEAASRDQYLGD